PQSVPVWIYGSAANDTTNVRSTTSRLTVDGQGGNDQVSIGSNAPANGTLSTIQSAVSVANSTGSTSLVVLDWSDTNSFTASLNTSSLTWYTTGSISWVAAPGGYGTNGGVTYLNFYGSYYAANTIYVNGPNVDTAFTGGAKTNNVLIYATSVQ